jgi:hypothetical protein
MAKVWMQKKAAAVSTSEGASDVIRIPLAVVLTLFLAACSGSTPAAPASATESPDVVAKNCADPQWKDKNLGLWYSVCRKPIDW